MSLRFSRWFMAPVLAMGLIGCGGGGIEEGMPSDVEQAEKEFQEQFRGMQQQQGDEMKTP